MLEQVIALMSRIQELYPGMLAILYLFLAGSYYKQSFGFALYIDSVILTVLLSTSTVGKLHAFLETFAEAFAGHNQILLIQETTIG
jgi:hypothetical protein